MNTVSWILMAYYRGQENVWKYVYACAIVNIIHLFMHSATCSLLVFKKTQVYNKKNVFFFIRTN